MRREAHNSLRAVLQEVIRHPIHHLVRKWNYKSAIASASLRSTVFFAANLSVGFDAAVAAFTTELVLRLTTSGFYGALTQAFRRVEPARMGTVGALIVLPTTAHALELLVHRWQATPMLGLSIVLSMTLTAVTTSFNLYAMRRGALVVGERDGRSLGADLVALPGLIVSFIHAGIRAIVRRPAPRRPVAGSHP